MTKPKKNPNSLCKTQILTRGWTKQEIHNLLGEPDMRGGWNKKLYLYLRITAAEDATPELAARVAHAAKLADQKALEQRLSDETRTAEREARFLNEFSGRDAALGAACQAMFRLNRAAKSHKFGYTFSTYEMKNALIRLLYEGGYAVAVYPHIPDQGGDPLVCFEFVVDGKKYCWHQLRGDVKFPVEYTGSPDAFEFRAAPENPYQTQEDLKSDYDLVEWVVGSQDSRRIPAA